MRAVDTNVLVRLQTRDDPAQTRAAEEFVAGGVWVPLVALIEMVWVLRAVYGRTPGQLAASLAQLLDHQGLVLQDADLVTAALAHYRRHPSVGFSDCLVLEQARKAGHLPLGTFDRRLARLEGAALV